MSGGRCRPLGSGTPRMRDSSCGRRVAPPTESMAREDLMRVLVFNCGSSSQNFKVYRVGDGAEPTVVAALRPGSVQSFDLATPAWEEEQDRSPRA